VLNTARLSDYRFILYDDQDTTRLFKIKNLVSGGFNVIEPSGKQRVIDMGDEKIIGFSKK